MKLATATITRRPVELLNAVEDRYGGRRPVPSTWHWRTDAPFDAIPDRAQLLVEAPEPFQLHFRLNGWREAEDRSSEPLGFGMHGVRLTSDDLRTADEVKFTLLFEHGKDRDDAGHCVRLTDGAALSPEPDVASAHQAG